MNHWTPDQITVLIESIIKLTGAILAVLYALKKTSNSIPNDIAHRMIDTAQQQNAAATSNSSISLPESTDATINVNPKGQSEVPVPVPSLEEGNTTTTGVINNG